MYVNRLIRPLSCRPLRLHLQRMTTRLPRELVWGYTPCSCWETPKVVDHKAINHTYIHYDGHTHKCFISNNSYIFFNVPISGVLHFSILAHPNPNPSPSENHSHSHPNSSGSVVCSRKMKAHSSPVIQVYIQTLTCSYPFHPIHAFLY